MNLLIAYASTDGMTAQIAEHLAETARELGHRTQIVNTAGVPGQFDVRPFDAILIGASVHARGYQRSAKRFIRNHLDSLNSKPSAFFSVCMAVASKDEHSRADARAIAEAFPAALGWNPAVVEVIAGALMFSATVFSGAPRCARSPARKSVSWILRMTTYTPTGRRSSVSAGAFWRKRLIDSPRRRLAIDMPSTTNAPMPAANC